jgi:hypothetical protein
MKLHRSLYPRPESFSGEQCAGARPLLGGAGQLSSGSGGQGRGAGAVTAEPPGWPSAPRCRDPGEVGPPGGWSPVARMSGRRPGRSLPCPPRPVRGGDVRLASARPVSRRPVSRRPVHPGVRTDTLRCPRRSRRASRAALDPGVGSVWRAAPRLGAAGRRAAVVRGRRGRLPASGLTGSDGTTLAMVGSYEGRP